MAEDIPRRLRRFYREGEEDGGETMNESNDLSGREMQRSDPVATTGGEQSEKYHQVNSHTRNEAIALALREVKKFMEQNKRLPRENERDEIAESLYSQMQSDMPSSNEKGSQSVAQRAALRRQRASEAKESNESVPSTAELLENQQPVSSEATVAPASSSNLDLSGLMLSDPLLGGKGSTGDNLLVENENVKNTCPHCQIKTDRIVYCPSCGNGFCPNCAKSAKSEGEKTNYTCPICAHAFASRNHS